jgi:hypothetical protein
MVLWCSTQFYKGRKENNQMKMLILPSSGHPSGRQLIGITNQHICSHQITAYNTSITQLIGIKPILINLVTTFLTSYCQSLLILLPNKRCPSNANSSLLKARQQQQTNSSTTYVSAQHQLLLVPWIQGKCYAHQRILHAMTRRARN